MSRVRYHTQQ